MSSDDSRENGSSNDTYILWMKFDIVAALLGFKDNVGWKVLGTLL